MPEDQGLAANFSSMTPANPEYQGDLASTTPGSDILRFDLKCGDEERALEPAGVAFEYSAIVMSEEEEVAISHKWECCRTGYVVGFNLHLPS